MCTKVHEEYNATDITNQHGSRYLSQKELYTID